MISFLANIVHEHVHMYLYIKAEGIVNFDFRVKTDNHSPIFQ